LPPSVLGHHSARMSFPSRELAIHCARLVDQKGGDEVKVLQLPATAHSFDFAVLVTAKSDRLTNALVEEIWHFCKRHGVPRMPVEGESGWMLIDCYDVVVHALNEEKRAYYQLDTLWPLAREVDWAKEAKKLGDPDRPETIPTVKKPARAKAVVETDEEVEAPAEKPVKAKRTKATAAAAAPAAKPKAKRPAKKKVADGEVEIIELEPKAAPKKRKPAPRVKRARDHE
jgi:ribosome-associated protein